MCRLVTDTITRMAGIQQAQNAVWSLVRYWKNARIALVLKSEEGVLKEKEEQRVLRVAPT